VAVAVALPVTFAAQLPAGASTATSPKALAKDLLPSSYANKSGFPKVADKATTTSKTSVTSCPNGAQEAFEAASGQSGVVSEVLACTTSKAAAAILSSVRTGTGGASAAPPKELGPSAIERSSGGSTYAIYWQRGALLEVLALNTDVPASSSASTSTTVAAPPITAAQQQTLARAAVKQDSQRK
jgi:hypothetical protein